jgi:hypothetical protein
VDQIMAADIFVVPTATGRLLFVLVMLAHPRRRVMHVARHRASDRRMDGTATPRGPSLEQRAALPDRERDLAFAAVGAIAEAMAITEVLTAHDRRGKTGSSNGSSDPCDESVSITRSS